MPNSTRRIRSLIAPEKLNISQDYAATIQFLDDINLVSRATEGKLWVDLRPLKSITPAGALLIVAAFDKWRRMSRGKKLRPVDADAWDPVVRQRLSEMGFFSFFSTQPKQVYRPRPGQEQFLPFETGAASDGEAAKRLREKIESLGPLVRDRSGLYDALVEAMANVREHAYPRDFTRPNWWLSASVDPSRRKLTIMFVDHGRSIPRTIPGSRAWERIFNGLANLGLGVTDATDANLIMAAATTRRSSTEMSFRGYGLVEDVLGFVDSHHGTGRLRILSRGGLFVHERLANGNMQQTTRDVSPPFRGTFIEWVIEDYGDA